MASAGAGVSEIFKKYAKFGKTETQIKEMKDGLRIEPRNVIKLMKESGVIDSKYTTQQLDSDIMHVVAKLTQSNSSKYPKGKKTLEIEGFDALVHHIAESKKSDYNTIVSNLNSVSGPSTAGTTGTSNVENVTRLTANIQRQPSQKGRSKSSIVLKPKSTEEKNEEKNEEKKEEKKEERRREEKKEVKIEDRKRDESL